MNGSTPRQRYLYLLSRLYELAAEFTEDELSVMIESFSHARDPIASQAVALISRLHNGGTAVADPNPGHHQKWEKEGRELSKAAALSRVELREPHVKKAYAKLLKSVFQDREAFPHLQDISDILLGSIQPKFKESRERYISRAIQHVLSMDDQTMNSFRIRLSGRIPSNRSPFMSQWKRLIEGL